MNKKALLLAMIVLGIAFAASTAGTASAVCGYDCFGYIMHNGGYIDPEGNPIIEGCGGNICGGDGATCSLLGVLVDCDDEDIYANPCAYVFCGGDEGGGIVVCGVYCIRYPYSNSPNDNPDPSAGDPPPPDCCGGPSGSPYDWGQQTGEDCHEYDYDGNCIGRSSEP